MAGVGEGLDARIRYPSYKSLDAHVDVERLRRLDGYIRPRLEARLALDRDQRFYTGPFLLDGKDPTNPGTRMVRLSCSTRPDDYFDLDNPDIWRLTHEAAEFSELMAFIATLPFSKTARMMIIYDDEARPVSPHRDHESAEICHEFIWFQTTVSKPFYMLRPETGEKQYVRSHTAWFDSVNQFHGSDAQGGLTFSIRVDGVFDDKFRGHIPRCDGNPAATPALWAALD